ncbi:hypothetical protein [Citrobacter freundii]|uniref:hypothetical protein n=1 Tax=Citrobacter freundii TaxID=546 RepID=UPI0028BF0F01|nr:hypothetical protein [Citrobacter freundii]MDT7379870.1 hypothetical protein [Citrobacter freundii]
MNNTDLITMFGYSITTTDFIAIISVIIAFFAMYQTWQQRIISNKPQILPKNTKFTWMHRDNLKLFKNIEISPTTLNIELLNIGLGPAIKIHHHWSEEYEKYIKINKLKIDNNNTKKSHEISLQNEEFFTIKDNNNFLNVDIFGRGPQKLNSFQKKGTLIEFITPNIKDKEKTTIPFPPLVPELIGNYLVNTAPSSFIGPDLTLEYKDVNNKKRKQIFTTEFKSVSFSGKGLDLVLDIDIIFTSKQCWTQVVLERIRKSYTDFMDEHDFNKNK